MKHKWKRLAMWLSCSPFIIFYYSCKSVWKLTCVAFEYPEESLIKGITLKAGWALPKTRVDYEKKTVEYSTQKQRRASIVNILQASQTADRALPDELNSGVLSGKEFDTIVRTELKYFPDLEIRSELYSPEIVQAALEKLNRSKSKNNRLYDINERVTNIE
jgi:hypothetical protein